MTTAVPAQESDPTTDLLASARALAPLLREQAAHNEASGHLTTLVEDALHEHRLFGMWTPRELGGSEVDPVRSLDILQTLSEADPSTAWVVMAASLATGTGGAYLGDEAVAEMFSGTRLPVVAGQGTRPGRAVRDGNGYRLSGEWNFASGIKHAQWIHTLGVVEETGQALIFVLPKSRATLSDNWDVMGLRATGSIDYSIDNVYVPAAFTHVGPTTVPLRGGSVLRLGIMHLSIIGHSAWALGVSRRMLDELADLVRSKVGRPGSLAESATFHANYGAAEAEWHAAHDFVHQAWSDVEARITCGLEPTHEQQTRVRLALYHATRMAESVSNVVYRAAGTTALRSGALQQLFRDVHAGTQHVTSAPAVLEACGRDLAGVGPESSWLYMNLVPGNRHDL
ncbi:acyl-CoA dehydrogenase family protein [Rhodococcus pyridinivorans]|uniref:Acyl-CoA dehydrogenase n=1 Tax=Rhodococcus pyridinivorans TaxID=103816 RepID=A0A7M2XKT2_9NOCA|nr:MULTISPECIES: acyl-CoA dehydrogenase family protein [Rhodococcus]MBX4171815.1 acyl-CoA dehydrogenase [Rhodococcus sp. DMU2021]QOV98368.1 acyl-CoA dehydrogenase [Rhodococcus pyridinivorans]UTM36841.1 acyl-CoA dehydrogenase [Rhodococcus pyridinivorans]